MNADTLAALRGPHLMKRRVQLVGALLESNRFPEQLSHLWGSDSRLTTSHIVKYHWSVHIVRGALREAMRSIHCFE